MMARLRFNGGSFDAPGLARGLRRTTPVAENLDRIFEHRKKRAGVEQVADVSQLDQGTAALTPRRSRRPAGPRFRTNAFPTMTVDGTGRVYVAWSERGFAQARPQRDRRRCAHHDRHHDRWQHVHGAAWWWTTRRSSATS